MTETEKEQLFSVAVDEYRSLITGMVFNAIRDPVEAEDVLQDIYTAFWKHLDNHRGEAKLTTVLFSIMKKKVATFIRAKKRRRELVNAFISKKEEFEDATAIRYYSNKREFRVSLLLHPLFKSVLSSENRQLLIAVQKSLWRCQDES